MPVRIRALRTSDHDQWRVLFQDYARFYETHFSDQVLDGVWAWLCSEEHPERGFVAVDGDTVVGIAHLQRQVDTFRAGAGWFLDDLYVLPARRGEGIGEMLIEHLRGFARDNGGGEIRWITASDNSVAQGLYDKIARRTSWVMYELDSDSHS